MDKINEKYKEVLKLKKDKENIKIQIEKANASLIEELAIEAGLKVGDKVRLSVGRVVFISRFFVSNSQNHEFAELIKDKVSKEEYAKMKKRKIALWAECYATTKTGRISKTTKPRNNINCLENCELIKD